MAKQMAAEDSRSVSQDAMSAKALLELAGTWEDDRDAAEIAREIRVGRRNKGHYLSSQPT